MPLFKKCEEYVYIRELVDKGIYPYFHELESKQDIEVMMEGKRRIMLGSNNYLGLTVNQEVIDAGVEAIKKYGTGCSGSRFLTARSIFTTSWSASWLIFWAPRTA